MEMSFGSRYNNNDKLELRPEKLDSRGAEADDVCLVM